MKSYKHIGCDLSPGLHHPHMTFNHSIFPDAIEIVTRAMLKAHKEASKCMKEGISIEKDSDQANNND